VTTAHAQATQMTAAVERAQVYSEPNSSSEVAGYIKKGRVVRTWGMAGAFYKVKLKTGEFGYVKTTDLEAKEIQLADDTQADSSGAEQNQDKEKNDDFNRWSVQLGYSAGSSGGRSYSEINLGVGYYFERWLEFHNSLFASFNRVTNIYGLDSSLRGVLDTGLGSLGRLHVFAGPGYRIASENQYNVLFAEAGVITSLMGFSFGGSVRSFFYSMKGSGYSDESQYSIILSGATSF
jgi:hypothetical protein